MKAASGIALVCSLTAMVLLIIAAYGSPDGVGNDCASCHSNDDPQGGYVFERPALNVVAPDRIQAGGTFQVMVRVTEPFDYDLVAPTAHLDLSGLPGSDAPSGDLVYLHRNGSAWTGMMRVRAGDQSGSVSIVVDYLAYHDHSQAENPDLSSYSETRTVGIVVAPGDTVEQGGSKDSPFGLFVIAIGPASILWWRIWRGIRKDP
jgi:hypothetical protein